MGEETRISKTLRREMRLLRKLADALLDGYHPGCTNLGVQVEYHLDPEGGPPELRARVKLTPRQKVTYQQLDYAASIMERAVEHISWVEVKVAPEYLEVKTDTNGTNKGAAEEGDPS